MRSHPCFPQSNDAFTLRQKRWLEENKENIPPPNLKRSNAFHHKKNVQVKEDEPEAIEEDDPEFDSEEEEGHHGSERELPARNRRN